MMRKTDRGRGFLWRCIIVRRGLGRASAINYPASVLADDDKKMALGKVRAYVEGFVGTRIPWKMGSWHATLGWGMKGVVVRVV